MIIKEIDYKQAIQFLLPKHYSGRKPQITKAFGWFDGIDLLAVCTFGKPASPSLCIGICGKNYASSVYELNRLCRVESLKLQLSQFVSGCLRLLSKLNWIIVSYADSDMNHNGYIYQACNFLYTGATKARTDKYTDGNRHSRHYSNEDQLGIRKIRSSKFRYVYFATKNKKLKKEWESNLKYPIMNYPKGENANYILGQFLQQKTICTTT